MSTSLLAGSYFFLTPAEPGVAFVRDNAINEMHRNGIFYNVNQELSEKLHDPDPEVRLTIKMMVAKSVGHSFVVASEPGVTKDGIKHTIAIKNDKRFPNSIAVCIQGGLEGLYQSAIYEKNPSGIMDYNIVLMNENQDSSLLVSNINLLSGFYNVFNIRILDGSDLCEQDNKVDANNKSKKKSFLAKLFGK